MRMGLAKNRARNRQPIPPPRQNHKEEKPYSKASCEVATVEEPPTRVPIMAPATMTEEDLPPPIAKSLAFFTWRPEWIPTPAMMNKVSSAPDKWGSPKVIIYIRSLVLFFFLIFLIGLVQIAL